MTYKDNINMYLPEEDIFHNVYVDSFKEQKLTSFKHNCDKYWADYKSVIMFSKTIEEINNFKNETIQQINKYSRINIEHISSTEQEIYRSYFPNITSNLLESDFLISLEAFITQFNAIIVKTKFSSNTGTTTDDILIIKIRPYWEKLLSSINNEDIEFFIKRYDPNCIDPKVMYIGNIFLWSDYLFSRMDFIMKRKIPVIDKNDFDFAFKQTLPELTKSDLLNWINNINNEKIVDKILICHNLYKTPYTTSLLLLSIDCFSSIKTDYINFLRKHFAYGSFFPTSNYKLDWLFYFSEYYKNKNETNFVKKITLNDSDYNLARVLSKNYILKILHSYKEDIMDLFKNQQFNLNLTYSVTNKNKK